MNPNGLSAMGITALVCCSGGVLFDDSIAEGAPSALVAQRWRYPKRSRVRGQYRGITIPHKVFCFAFCGILLRPR